LLKNKGFYYGIQNRFLFVCQYLPWYRGWQGGIMEETSRQRQADKVVIKHSAAIQIQNNITLLQRRTWNVLLAHAYNELPFKEKYNINVYELLNVLDFSSRNTYYKEALEALVSCKVKWNFLDKDGEVWGVAPLLAGVEIKNGVCTYAFSPMLRERLHNPRMYARISLSLQNRFDSKHAQALWELCVDYLGHEREYGETPFIALEAFKEMMGVEEGMYSLFKLFSQRVLRPSLAEINRVSDLQVTVGYQRKGRKVEALKFKIRRMAMLPVADYRQPTLFPDLEDMPEVVKRLKEAGLAESDAWDVWQKGWEFVSEKKRPAGDVDLLDYVREKIDLLRQRQQAGNVKNPAGFLMTALKQNFSHAEYEQKQAAEKRAEKRKQLQQLMKERERLEKAQDKDLETLCDKVIELPGQADKAIKALEAMDDQVFQRFYEQGISAMEHYRKNRPISMMMGKWLEDQFPEQFEAVRQPYREKIAAIDKQIAALEADGISAK
jgi:hypothetical protein